MHPHWRYVIEGTLGRISRVVASAWTATPERIDEGGNKYAVDVEDSAAVLIELENGINGSVFGSWATRVRLDEPLSLHVDGANGSAVAGLHHCYTQPLAQTPDVAWSPNIDPTKDHRKDWTEVPDLWPYPNSYRVGWEGFISHVLANTPFASDLSAGVRDVMLAEACYSSARENRWVSMREFERDLGIQFGP
jgi:predicted dehydrogenase